MKKTGRVKIRNGIGPAIKKQYNHYQANLVWRVKDFGSEELYISDAFDKALC